MMFVRRTHTQVFSGDLTGRIVMSLEFDPKLSQDEILDMIEGSVIDSIGTYIQDRVEVEGDHVTVITGTEKGCDEAKDPEKCLRRKCDLYLWCRESGAYSSYKEETNG